MRQVHGSKELDFAYLLLESRVCGITIFFKDSKTVARASKSSYTHSMALLADNQRVMRAF